MFKIVKESGLGTLWYPVKNGSTLYVGQIVYKNANNDYIEPLPSADTDIKKIVGVVIATNDKIPKYSSAYNANYITGVATQAAQLSREWQGVQGMWSLGDPIPMVQVELIGKDTVLKGTFGAALTEFSPTANVTDGSSITITEASPSGIANNTIFYCRKGRNRGIYRIASTVTDNGSTVTYGFATYWPYAISTTDKFVKANVGLGNCKFQTSTDGWYVLPNDTLNFIYYNVIVEEVDFSTSDLETVTFRFE